MRQKIVNIYKFNELSERSKLRAIEFFKEDDISQVDRTDVVDTYTELLNDMGFNNPKIYYDCGYSQGSGACFDCDSLDIEILAITLGYTLNKAKLLQQLHDAGHFEASLYNRNSSYMHSNCYIVDYSIDTKENNPKVAALISDFCDALEVLRKSKSDEIYKGLCEAIEYYWDDKNAMEYVTELCEANDYEFTESGELV